MVVRLGIWSSQSASELSSLEVGSASRLGVGDLVWAERAERLSAVVWDSLPASADIRVSSGAV